MSLAERRAEPAIKEPGILTLPHRSLREPLAGSSTQGAESWDRGQGKRKEKIATEIINTSVRGLRAPGPGGRDLTQAGWREERRGEEREGRGGLLGEMSREETYKQ